MKVLGYITAACTFLGTSALLMATIYDISEEVRPRYLTKVLNATCIVVTIGGFVALWWSTGADMTQPTVVAARWSGLTILFMSLGMVAWYADFNFS